MKHTYFLVSLLTCIITVTTSNALLLPRLVAFFGTSMSKHYTQSISLCSINEATHMLILNVMDPSNIAQSTESAIQRNAGVACSSNRVLQWLRYALYFAKDNPNLEHKYAQLIDCTLKYATADKRDYVNTELWNNGSVLRWNLYGTFGTFPLHEAVSYSLPTITNVLLQHKAMPALPNSRGRTALHLARKPEMAHILLRNGAPINAQDEKGNSPLHLANNEIIPILLEHGADVALKNKEMKPLCTYAYYQHSRGWVPEKDPANQVTIDEQMAIIEAYVNDNAIGAEDKKDLINIEIDLERGDYKLKWCLDRVTPPMRALLHSDVERFETFLTFAAPAALTKQLNPLQLAASCGAVKYEESKKFVRMLDEYKKKHQSMLIKNS